MSREQAKTAVGRTAERSKMVARGKSDEIGRHPWIN